MSNEKDSIGSSILMLIGYLCFDPMTYTPAIPTLLQNWSNGVWVADGRILTGVAVKIQPIFQNTFPLSNSDQNGNFSLI